MENPQPRPQHKWLQRLVGDWTYETECPSEPGKPPHKFTGTESVRAVGDLWVIGQGTCPMPDGSTAQTLIALGFDPVKNRFVGTWLASMMTHLWVYDGELDAARNVLTLHAQGPSCLAEGKMTAYKDVIELRSDDHRVLTSHCQGEDGQWQQFMEAHYRRVK